MRANLKNVDCVIEIHDARISLLFTASGLEYIKNKFKKEKRPGKNADCCIKTALSSCYIREMWNEKPEKSCDPMRVNM